jgi:hypothetical protein
MLVDVLLALTRQEPVNVDVFYARQLIQQGVGFRDETPFIPVDMLLRISNLFCQAILRYTTPRIFQSLGDFAFKRFTHFLTSDEV